MHFSLTHFEIALYQESDSAVPPNLLAMLVHEFKDITKYIKIKSSPISKQTPMAFESKPAKVNDPKFIIMEIILRRLVIPKVNEGKVC